MLLRIRGIGSSGELEGEVAFDFLGQLPLGDDGLLAEGVGGGVNRELNDLLKASKISNGQS